MRNMMQRMKRAGRVPLSFLKNIMGRAARRVGHRKRLKKTPAEVLRMRDMIDITKVDRHLTINTSGKEADNFFKKDDTVFVQKRQGRSERLAVYLGEGKFEITHAAHGSSGRFNRKEGKALILKWRDLLKVEKIDLTLGRP